jgi:hypothetical protein
MFLFAALLFASSARAADLDLTVQLGAAAPQAVTFRDVVGRDLPELLVMGDAGELRCAKVVVSSVDGGAYQVEVTLAPVRSGPRGRARVAARVFGGRGVVSPRITVSPNRVASFSQGPRLRPGQVADAAALARADTITVVVRE